MPTKKDILDIIDNEVIGRNDIAFTHSVFVQCFLPLRSLKQGNYRWEVAHGKSSLLVKAGELINPANIRDWQQCEIPAGAKARLLLTYINDQAIRTKSPVIDMGHSMRDFMDRSGVPVCGSNGKELVRQAKNIAAAEILLGIWGGEQVRQEQTKIARRLSFWIEKNPSQGTLWQPEMTLATDYYNVLKDYRVPVDFRAMVGLQESPRAMDVYLWLSYRMRNVKKPTRIPYAALHSVFGTGIKKLYHFKQRLKLTLKEVIPFYPEAKIDFMSDKDYVTLYPSKPAIPENTASHARRGHFPRK